MSAVLERFGQRLLFGLDPETAHHLSLKALRRGLVLGDRTRPDPCLAIHKAGLEFPNPLGMAAGYDKNAEAPDALLRLGFGFAEVGTVTPLAQPGNPRPRIFRLVEDEAVINRLGFNNQGHAAALRRLKARGDRTGIVGVNIGANKESTDREADYVAGVETFAPLASYLTVNISSPNTPGLRALQGSEALASLLGKVLDARRRSAAETGRQTPIFVKVAPDLSASEIEAIGAEAVRAGIDGIIVSNTTVAREGLVGRRRDETGGLSGKPLFARATTVLARMRQAVGPEMVLVGAGGVNSAATALEKIRAGADLVQLYTGMIYGGPGLPGTIIAGLGRIVRDAGLSSISELRDSALKHWANRPLR